MPHFPVGPTALPREASILARSPLYPLLPGALVRLLVTQGARAFAEALLADRLQTPTVVWNVECRDMLGQVLREVEGTTPGLQDVPAARVQEAGQLLENLYSEKGGVPVLFTSPYYVQLMTESYHVEHPEAFLFEVASVMTDVLQGPDPQGMGRAKGRARCISTPLENEGDVVLLCQPLLWTLRQHAHASAHASRGGVCPEGLMRAIGAVASPLLDVTARVAVACSHSEEALTSLEGFTESLSLALAALGRSGRLTAQMDGGGGGGSVREDPESPQGAGVTGRDGGGGEGRVDRAWTIVMDLSKVDTLLTMLKQLDDQESAAHLMRGGNQVLRCLGTEGEARRAAVGIRPTPIMTGNADDNGEIPGLSCYVSGLVSALVNLDAPSAVLAATEGIGLAASGFGSDAHMKLLYKSQVYIPLIAHCLRPEDKRGSCPGLGIESAKALHCLSIRGHEGMNRALLAMLTSGGLTVLRRSPEECLQVLRHPDKLEAPRLIWGPDCTAELEGLVMEGAPTKQEGKGKNKEKKKKSKKKKGEGDSKEDPSPNEEDPASNEELPLKRPGKLAKGYRKVTAQEVESFTFESLKGELVVDGVYLRILVKEARREGDEPSTGGAGPGSGIALPTDLLASVFVHLGAKMRLTASGEAASVIDREKREAFFADVALLLQALLGLSIGEGQVPEVLADSGSQLFLLWAAMPPNVPADKAGPASAIITRTCIHLMHAFLSRAGSNGKEALVASGAIAPAVHAFAGLLSQSNVEMGSMGRESRNGIGRVAEAEAALHVLNAMLVGHQVAARHMLSIGAVPLLLSRVACKDIPKGTRLRSAVILNRLSRFLPDVSIALGRVLPELLLLHLETDGSGKGLVHHIDDTVVAPLLVWDNTCRDRLCTSTWDHWTDWKGRATAETCFRWVPAYLPEEVLLPVLRSEEPCIAGLYFRLYTREPGFLLEQDLVEGFLECAIEAMLAGKVAEELVPELLEALYYALASLGDGGLGGASRKANGLWPILFTMIWKELGVGRVRYDKSPRAGGGVSSKSPKAKDKGKEKEKGKGKEKEKEKEKGNGKGKNGAAVLMWAARLVCLMVAVPVHWTAAGAGAQIISDDQALAMVSSKLDDDNLRLFLVTARAVIASKAEEGVAVAHQFVSPVVLRTLVDKLSAYKVQAITGTVAAGKSAQSAQSTSSSDPAAVAAICAGEDGFETESLVIKLLACLMQHPQEGERTRLVLREEAPEALYLALLQLGTVASDVRLDAVATLPSLPPRDSENRLYPKVRSGDSLLGTSPESAPLSLKRPMTIYIDANRPGRATEARPGSSLSASPRPVSSQVGYSRGDNLGSARSSRTPLSRWQQMANAGWQGASGGQEKVPQAARGGSLSLRKLSLKLRSD
ncbi:unnamed protein product, partial [Discosporangium mesarthrocarpum]